MVGPGKLLNSDTVKAYLNFTILESVGVDGSEKELEEMEEVWRNRLQSWAPAGLNIREDGPSKLRTKRSKIQYI
jgi:hypothetical protein